MGTRRQTQHKSGTADRELARNFRAIFEQSPIGIVLYDSGGRLTAINPAALEMFGIALEKDILNIPLFQEPNLPAGVAERMLAGESVRLTAPYDFDRVNKSRLYPTTKSGTIMLGALFTPLGTASRPTGFLLQIEDVTTRMQNKIALESAIKDAERLRRETAGLLTAARAVLMHKDFAAAAGEIFRVCKKLIGAAAGYVALLSTDGKRNELAFLDAGDLSCVVDPALPMPIRGLREEAYRTGRPVWENDFAASAHAAWLPAGHAPLHNVLFVPLLIDGATMGILGLANKPGGFFEPDASLALAFGELAAIALMNNRATLEIERSLREKEVLLREIHHRVKNNLQVVISLLTLQMESIHDERARLAFQKSMDRIRSMSLIHEQLLKSGDLSGICMQVYLDELLAHLMQSYGVGPDLVRTEARAGDLVLDIDAAVTCGLIVNELVSNSLKHAFPAGRKGRIAVRLNRQAHEEVVLAVSDSGTGIPAALLSGNGGTTGLNLVKVLCEQLGGTAEITGKRGARFRVVFSPRG